MRKELLNRKDNRKMLALESPEDKRHTLSALIRILLKLLQLKVLRRKSPLALS